MTTNSLKELTALLAEKVRVLDAVMDKLAEWQRCIVEARPEVLVEKTCNAEEGFNLLNSINARFRTLLPKVADELGLPENSSLSALISAADPESGIKLRELQKRCFSVAAAIASLLKMNEHLIKNSLEIIGRSLTLFSNFLKGTETYGAAGRMSGGRSSTGIICREI
jgi:hypothetical protein